MTAATPSARITRAVAALKAARPAYRALLDVYEKIFLAQERSREELTLSPIQLPADLLAVKAREELPLVAPEEFVIDDGASGALFTEILGIAETATPTLAGAAEGIRNAEREGKLSRKALFAALLGSDEAPFDRLEAEFGVAPQAAAFMVYNALYPSLTACSEQLATFLKAVEDWNKGYCPVCGSPPALSEVSGEGKRSLHCNFCWHRWPVRRIFCPTCGNTDGETLQYLYSDEEPEHRVDLCETCQGYIKGIDARKLPRPFHPPLEHLATIHLDLKAQEKEYQSAAPMRI